MTNDISQLKGLKIKAYATDRYAEDRDEHIMVMHTVEISGDNTPWWKTQSTTDGNQSKRRSCSFLPLLNQLKSRLLHGHPKIAYLLFLPPPPYGRYAQ